jgi:2-dehydropantoate 2-reductase
MDLWPKTAHPPRPPVEAGGLQQLTGSPAKPTIAILGPGGVGGFLAAALARAGTDVVVVAHEQTAALITERGIELQSLRLGDFTAHPRAAATLEEPVDTLFVATKAAGLEPALERIGVAPAVVVPLLNGLDHMTTVRARFGWPSVAAGTIRIEADRPAPAQITQTSPFLRIDMASDDPALAERLEAVKIALERADVPATIGVSEAQVLWSKLVRLNALACTTSASERPIGLIRSDPEWRAALEACITEAAAVANADGAQIDPAALLAELDDAHAALGSSMQRDIAAGREPELDAIPGAVLRAAKRHGLKCPTIARLSEQIAHRAGVSPPRV